MLRRLSLQTTAHRVLALTTIPLLSLSSTYLTYGAVAEQKKRKARMGRSASLAASAAPEAAASRSAYRAKSAGIGGLGKRDLIADSASGTVRLDKLADAEMPLELQGLKAKEQRQVLAEKKRERKEIQSKIIKLNKDRGVYIKQQAAKSGAQKDSFDSEVLEAVRTKAKSKGIEY